jgi:hypothetical protein
MSHFAKISNGVVVQVIVAEQDFINSLADSADWVQTSYNTYGGVHKLGGAPLRKNYAGVGYSYDTERDAFIPPKPLPSWVLDEESCLWVAPVAYPADGKTYAWDESSIAWIEVE